MRSGVKWRQDVASERIETENTHLFHTQHYKNDPRLKCNDQAEERLFCLVGASESPLQFWAARGFGFTLLLLLL